MTEEAPPDTRSARRGAPEWIVTPVDAAHHAIENMGAGDRAALRKLQPGAVQVPAFWRLSTSVLAPALDRKGVRRSDAEDQWATILATMERTQHAKHRHLGAALAAAGVSEMRVTRLLRAHGPALADAVRAVAHQLETSAQPFDQAELAWLVLSDGHRDEDDSRRQIARHYYGAIAAE